MLRLCIYIVSVCGIRHIDFRLLTTSCPACAPMPALPVSISTSVLHSPFGVSCWLGVLQSLRPPLGPPAVHLVLRCGGLQPGHCPAGHCPLYRCHSYHYPPCHCPLCRCPPCHCPPCLGAEQTQLGAGCVDAWGVDWQALRMQHWSVAAGSLG